MQLPTVAEQLRLIATATLQSPQVDDDSRGFSGVAGDARIAVRFVYSATDEFLTEANSVEVNIHTTRTPLTIAMRPRRGRPEYAFDQVYRFEAAPSDVARELFDVDLRARLTALEKIHLETRAPGHFVLSASRPVDTQRATALVEVAALLGSGVNAAYAAADRVIVEQTGSPYRAEVDARPSPRIRERREREVADLALVLAARRKRRKLLESVGWSALATGVVAAVVAIAQWV